MTENQKLREVLLSDMDIAVLRMPVNMAFAGNMAQFQYHNRVQALLNRIEALAMQPDVPETNFGKLREALQAISHIDDTTNHSVDASAALDRIGQIARQALALPTADHLPDAGKMIETAAPVCEREAFEREMSKPPFEFCMDRWPDDGSSYAWPGNYATYHTQCAWAAWQARAALSAGDAVDAQRYRWLMDNCTLGIKQNGVGWSLNTSACVAPDCIKDVGAAIDAAMRKDKT
jgi:hypothetical protein